MSKIIRRIGRTICYPINYLKRNVILKDIYSKLNEIEYRNFNRRFYAIEQTTDYLVGAQIPGDYLEFGVYKGSTFAYAYKWMSPHFGTMNFIAFDSFEGLPEPKGIDAEKGYASNFHKNEFSCTEKEFLNNLRDSGVDLNRVKTVKGWFDETLKPEKAQNHGVTKIAVAWIDCDLYESTIPVLNFITPYLSIGSVIIFDDWRCYRNNPDFGEQKACREWLNGNQQISLAELFSFGWNGIAFTVTAC